MYFLVDGRAEAIVNVGTPKEITFCEFNNGQYFGEISLLLNTPRTCSIRAATFCSLIVLTRFDFGSLVYYYPQLKALLLHRAKRSVRTKSAKIDEATAAKGLNMGGGGEGEGGAGGVRGGGAGGAGGEPAMENEGGQGTVVGVDPLTSAMRKMDTDKVMKQIDTMMKAEMKTLPACVKEVLLAAASKEEKERTEGKEGAELLSVPENTTTSTPSAPMSPVSPMSPMSSSSSLAMSPVSPMSPPATSTTSAAQRSSSGRLSKVRPPRGLEPTQSAGAGSNSSSSSSSSSSSTRSSAGNEIVRNISTVGETTL